jgi:hypothetical protein
VSIDGIAFPVQEIYADELPAILNKGLDMFQICCHTHTPSDEVALDREDVTEAPMDDDDDQGEVTADTTPVTATVTPSFVGTHQTRSYLTLRSSARKSTSGT